MPAQSGTRCSVGPVARKRFGHRPNIPTGAGAEAKAVVGPRGRAALRAALFPNLPFPIFLPGGTGRLDSGTRPRTATALPTRMGRRFADLGCVLKFSRGAAGEGSPRREPWVGRDKGTSPGGAEENRRWKYGGLLSPLRGLARWPVYPRLVPWATFLRASGADWKRLCVILHPSESGNFRLGKWAEFKGLRACFHQAH